MDTLVENSGVAEQEKQIQVVPTENEKQIQVPIENAEMAGEEPARDIKIVRAEKPDPLGRKTINLPVNEIKAGYRYAFGKSGRKR